MAGQVQISLAESAIRDLENIQQYYRDQQVPEIGEKRVGRILSDIEMLCQHPDMGRIVPEFDLDYLRELIRPPFRIIYRRDPKRVRIVRVWRSERLLESTGL